MTQKTIEQIHPFELMDLRKRVWIVLRLIAVPSIIMMLTGLILFLIDIPFGEWLMMVGLIGLTPVFIFCGIGMLCNTIYRTPEWS